jgi:peptide/nickel transport system substrate-binding protein
MYKASRARPAHLALAIVLTIVAACPGNPPAQPLPPRLEIRVGVPGLPEAIAPGAALEGPEVLIARQIFDTLVAYQETSTDIEPALAVQWSVSRDGLVWSFTLRDNVRFHDGTALAVADVVASFQRTLKGGGGPVATVWAALLRGLPGVVREVRAGDSRTVQFFLNQPYAALLTVLAHPGFSVVREVAGPEGTPRLVGTGPYRIGETSPGRLVLEAVPYYWGGPPRNERLVFLDVSTDDHAEAELDAGALDIWLPAEPPRRMQGALSAPGSHVGYLAFQTEKEPFSRKPLRQAVAAAIDPAMLGIALGATAVPLQSYLPPGVWARREGSPILGGTRQRVARLLRAGQWPAGFTPTLLVPSEGGRVDMQALAEVLRVSLEGADISVKPRLESPEAASTARAAGEHDLALVEGTVLGGDPHLFLSPLSTSEGAVKGSRAFNYSFYRNPRLDDVLTRASQLGFRPERVRLYQRAQVLLAEEMPWLPLYVELLWAVVSPDVRGLRLHPTGIHRLGTVTMAPPPS